MSAAIIDAPVIVTEPGVYDDIPNDAYHSDPVPGGSLSSSGAKLLLPPSTPAHYRWRRDNPEPPKAVYEFGSAAHTLVLGVGEPIEVIDADSWRTKAAKDAADEAREAGRIPLLPEAAARAQGMAAALRAHETAAALFAPGSGVAEASMFAAAPNGVMMRARTDWLPQASDNGLLILPDYKTTQRADTESLIKTVHNFRYAFQGCWYSDVIKALGLAEQVAFVLVFQEVDPPHLVHVVQPDRDAMDRARDLVNTALAVYADCSATDHTDRCADDCEREHPYWPGYSDGVTQLPMPRWA